MDFKVLDYVDATLVAQEGKEPRASRVPAVWPSEASADRIDKTESKIVGACHRKSFGRMVGWPVTNKIDPVAAWRFVTGRSVEDHLTTLAKATQPAIYVANGIRHFVPDIYLPFEIDLVVKQPESNRGWIVECKTIYGYMANKQIMSEGKPKLENIMQLALYLLEVKDGKRLKEIITAGLASKAAGDRTRIDADISTVQQLSDAKLGAKLVYISRDECNRKEFNITVEEDFDGFHYPCIDGMMWKVFTVESIYDRYKTLQQYWYVARAEAERRLEAKGVTPPPSLRLVRGPQAVGTATEPIPTGELTKEEQDFIIRLERETASLPQQFWPPAEYDWSYSSDKIEKLYQRGTLGKIRYNDWKKKKIGADRIGDWQCAFCPFKQQCIPTQNPALAYMVSDLDEFLPVENE